MSRSTDSATRRTLALAGLVLTAALAAPAAAQAQGITSERMLLNRTPLAVSLSQGLAAGPTAPIQADAAGRMDAASALLGRHTADTGRRAAPATVADIEGPEPRIEGRRALLGLVVPAGSRGEGDQ
jgi:hypothetical protein